MPPETINTTGPKCAFCGVRPDDPLWVQPVNEDKDLACFGCVADIRRYKGVRILGRAIFVREIFGFAL